jgi:hypothetical protein
MWAAQYYPFDKPRRWINSGGLGTMGFGLPAAMGAKLADLLPSPVTQATSAFGSANFAPIAAGNPKPIVPKPPELIQRPKPTWQCTIQIVLLLWVHALMTVLRVI